jgi:hypothetical protein
VPFSAQEIVDAGYAGMDYQLSKKPVDQIGMERPLLKALQAKKKEAPGAKQYVVEKLRTSYGSNFQWFNGSSVVTYNRRQTLTDANYAWRSCHDGLALDEDRLAQNGITITDDGKTGQATDAEKIQFVNLIEEQTEVLRLGFQEQFSHQMHLDGTQSSDAVVGVDSLVSLAPTSGTVGGINRATAANAYWRNNVATGLTTTTTTGTILNQMELGWRACMRNGGKPDLILAGSSFIDGYRQFVLNTYGRMDFGPANEKVIEGGTKSMTFHGVEMQWSPEFAELDSRYGPATTWEKRCYMLNLQHLRLRPLSGHNMVSRKPPRAYDRYEYYWAVTWRGALTMDRANAHWVGALT